MRARDVVCATARALLVGMGLGQGAAALAQDNPWAGFAGPAPGPAQAIGGYTAGCLLGAAALLDEQPGTLHMRPQRRRNFGHPQLLAYLRGLGEHVHGAGHGLVLVGDMAMARGGPTLTNHISHQSGLDVDVWFLVPPAGTDYSAKQRREMPAPSYVDWSARRLEAGFGPAQVALIRYSAEREDVQRVLVNPVIKQHLCATAGESREWLRKVRSWWGHADHMHVRLHCPRDSPLCAAQAPPPPGDGCGAALDWWFSAAAETAGGTRAAPRLPALPAACEPVRKAP